LLIVAYDIADDRRRSRVARELEAIGDRLQESVFQIPRRIGLCPDAVLARLRPLIDAAQDRIDVFTQCRHCARAAAAAGTAMEAAPRGGAVV
jgi:CRISPR-associated protein Cas2